MCDVLLRMLAYGVLPCLVCLYQSPAHAAGEVTEIQLDKMPIRNGSFFKTEEALALFQAGTPEFAGQANATVGVANVSATPGYNEGVAVFTNIGGGLMLEGSIGGHLYNYRAVQ